MSANKLKRPRIWLLIILLIFNLLAGVALYNWRNRKLKEQQMRSLRVKASETGPTTYGVLGLSEEEAAKRQPDFDLESEQRVEDRKFIRRAIRQSLLTTYNIDLFGIAIINFLLGNPMGSLGNALIVLLNLVLNVFQQSYTRHHLKKFVKDLHPQANVIREGRLYRIEPYQIVEGDCLVISEGDEFMVDGKLIGSSSIVVEGRLSKSPESVRITKGPGDDIVAGSYCLQGRSVYRANQSGLDRHRPDFSRQLKLLLGELTPLQRFMETIFRALFGLVLVFSSLLIVDALIIDANLVSPLYREAFSIIFAIAPTSLFFVLIVTYATGILRISDRGALVYDTTSIETMANASFLCINKDSLISGFHVELEPSETTTLPESPSENMVRRMLGDFIHSMPNLNMADQMLLQAFPGQPRLGLEIAPLLLEQGWHGGAFDEPDLRGTYILGLHEVIEGHLALTWKDIPEGLGSSITNAQHRVGGWLRNRVANLRRSDQSEVAAQNDRGEQTESPETQPPLWKRLFNRLDQLLSPMEDQAFFESQFREKKLRYQLIFAYLPEPEPIFDSQDQPKIPNGLIPLAKVSISDNLRPEAENSIRSLMETGLRVKILSSEPGQDMIPIAADLDLPAEYVSISSSKELAELDEDEFAQKVDETSLIGDLAPSQKADVIKSLRLQNQGVIMVGSNVSDIPALKQANLRVVLKKSAQAALKLTDIVLLEDSLAALPHVLITGQRLVNGILDVFKLYLSQIIAQLLLILFMLFLGMDKYPIHTTQAGFVTAIAIAFPNIFLSVWAGAGRTADHVFRRQMAHFILPAALTTAFLAWGVFLVFLNQTQDEEYAQLAVTYAMLMAGWLRILFVQPPSAFWTGGAPLRGDRRVIWVLMGSMLLFAAIISVPLFSELLRISWLRAPLDYLWIALAVAIWALFTRAIWRSGWLKVLIDKI